MKYVISGPLNPIQVTTYIPSSKSISNRLLVMMALSGDLAEPENLSESDDTRLLQNAIKSDAVIKDVGHAGTAMRFLTAYFSTRSGTVVLTGSDRMKQRPVGPLVKALCELGATITYMEKEGCPPLEIKGGLERGGQIKVDGGISSQFISALMMIGPVLKGGLNIILTGNVVSSTYIRMTQALMKKGGIEVTFNGRNVAIEEGRYRFNPVAVESDWSGASYWYQVAALSPGSSIRLPHLESESLQGDSVLASMFESLGVESRFDDGGVTLHSDREILAEHFSADFTGCPDLVQTCAATLCGLGIPFHLAGTRTLRVKETDRIAALQAELGKLGYMIESDKGGDWLSWDGHKGKSLTNPVIETYHDHRMAMAFAPLAIPLGSMTINDPMVVTKSYPDFWNDLDKAGFSIRTS